MFLWRNKKNYRISQNYHQILLNKCVQLASVAQLDALPTGDQEVAGSTPTGSATFFCGDMMVKYFLRSFSPSADSRWEGVSFWQKKVHSTG